MDNAPPRSWFWGGIACIVSGIFVFICATVTGVPILVAVLPAVSGNLVAIGGILLFHFFKWLRNIEKGNYHE